MSTESEQQTDHHIEWRIDKGMTYGKVTCEAQHGAFCRMTCSAFLCEEWPREGCEHGLVDSGDCNVVEHIENGDSIESAYIGPVEPLRSGPIEAKWQGDWYGWRYAS